MLLEGTKLEGLRRFRVWCSECKKWGYPSEESAEQALREARETRFAQGRKRRIECDHYPARCGSYHLTSRRQG